MNQVKHATSPADRARGRPVDNGQHDLKKNILDTAAVDKDLDFDSANFQSEAASEQPEDLETAPGENQQTAKKAVSKTTKTKSKSPKTSTTAKKSKSGVKKKQATT